MHLAARPPLARLAAIDLAVRAGTYPNARTLAAQLEVNQRTIQRDIDFLRTRMGAPLEYDAQRNGYHYTQTDFLLPTLHLTEGELVAFFLAGEVLAQYQGTPFGPALTAAYRRLTDLLTAPVTVQLPQATAALAVVPLVGPVHDPAVFHGLAGAVVASEQVEIMYFSAGRQAQTTRRVNPYRLAFLHGGWYLIGYCQVRTEVLTFAAHRISAVRRTGTRFERSTDFSLADYLAGSFRIWRGPTENVVERRFAPTVAAHVLERQWHATQTTSRDADGGVRMRLVVNDLREIKGWILSWGAGCEALEPPALRALLHDDACRMMELYEDNA